MKDARERIREREINDIEVAERAFRRAIAADYNKWLKVVKMGFKGTRGLSKIDAQWIER